MKTVSDKTDNKPLKLFSDAAVWGDCYLTVQLRSAAITLKAWTKLSITNSYRIINGARKSSF